MPDTVSLFPTGIHQTDPDSVCKFRKDYGNVVPWTTRVLALALRLTKTLTIPKLQQSLDNILELKLQPCHVSSASSSQSSQMLPLPASVGMEKRKYFSQLNVSQKFTKTDVADDEFLILCFWGASLETKAKSVSTSTFILTVIKTQHSAGSLSLGVCCHHED